MAKFSIKKYYDFGTKGYHNATTWEVATDPDFNDVIDRSVKDTVNVKSWHSPLLKPNGGYYTTLEKIYVRVKVWVDDIESDWFYLNPNTNQNDQTLKYTEKGKKPVFKNSLEIGFNQGE